MKADRGCLIQRVGHRLFVTRSLCGVSGTEAVPEEVKHEGDVTEDAEGDQVWYRDYMIGCRGWDCTRHWDETPRGPDRELIGARARPRLDTAEG